MSANDNKHQAKEMPEYEMSYQISSDRGKDYAGPVLFTIFGILILAGVVWSIINYAVGQRPNLSGLLEPTVVGAFFIFFSYNFWPSSGLSMEIYKDHMAFPLPKLLRFQDSKARLEFDNITKIRYVEYRKFPNLLYIYVDIEKHPVNHYKRVLYFKRDNEAYYKTAIQGSTDEQRAKLFQHLENKNITVELELREHN